MSKRAATYHKKASQSLTRAAKHHAKAATHHETGRHEAAERHANAARSQTLQGARHAEKALKAYVEHIQLLMHEVSHRAKNMLNLVQAIARLSATGEPESFLGRFAERIQALAANQDLLVRNDWRGVDIEHLVRAQLAHFADLMGVRIALHGPKELCLNAAAAQCIGLTLHELATNAGKYGALSTDDGRVDVSWGVDGEMFTMSWIEHDGPLVSQPERLGFGSTVITALAELTIGGHAQLEYAPSGATWRLTCPAAKALCRRVDASTKHQSRKRTAGLKLSSKYS